MDEKQSAYEWATNRDGYRVLIRNKHPRFAIEVQDDADDRQLANALRKAAEFVLKGGRIAKYRQKERCVVKRNGRMYAVGLSWLSPEDEWNTVGDICDDGCYASCTLFQQGTCPYVTIQMSNGEQVKFLRFDKPL